jgi:putative nucleotidyltransferase-like protein
VRSRDDLRRGTLIATVLAGSWRNSDFPPLNITEAELDEVTPLLCISGAAALGWRRVSNSHLKDTASADVLRQAYRLQSLQASIHEQQVEQTFRVFRHASIDAILAKGWAAASYYQDNLRPAGDIDICVRPGQYKLAQEALKTPEAIGLFIDLHRQFEEIEERPFSEIFARAQLLRLGEEDVRTFGPEDHLALLCIHFLKHGGWRPLWLCDIGTVIESLPPSFDWEICLGSNNTRARWIVAAINLANRLLGADVRKCPAAAQGQDLPVWFVENVLKQWRNPSSLNQAPMSHPVPMVELLRRPRGLLKGLRQRWPDPILATISVNGEFNRYPRFPYQIANCLSRIKRLLLRWPGEWQEE